MSLLASILFLACTPMALLDFTVAQWRADKDVRVADAYKHLYQATRGGEHAVPDRASAAKWMDNEWRTMGEEAKGEVVWEPLCPGGEIGRLNLRPFKSKGGKSDDLLDAFLASASEYKSEPKAFTDAWFELGKRLKKRRIGKLDHKSWTKLDVEMKKKNYPAVHHSESFNKARRPAYRILTSAHARRLISP
jgi:hypothetical protein